MLNKIITEWNKNQQIEMLYWKKMNTWSQITTYFYPSHKNNAIERPKTTLCDNKYPGRRQHDAWIGWGNKTTVERSRNSGLLWKGIWISGQWLSSLASECVSTGTGAETSTFKNCNSVCSTFVITNDESKWLYILSY